MRTLNTLIIFALGISLLSCVKEDHFGHSNWGEIKEIQVTNQSGPAIIDSKSKTIDISIIEGVALDEIEIVKLELSSFAQADLNEGDFIDLRFPQQLKITSENNSETIWTIEASVASSQPQLNNSDFNKWYETSAGYLEPGDNASSTIWGTGNPGGAILDKIATTPFTLGDGTKAVHLETLDNGFLGQIAKTPITAATIYTGKFNSNNIDINNPRAAVELGTPFTGRPAQFRIKYTYQPGAENKNRDGQTLSYGDEMDMYMFLEVRENGKAKRLATGWIRSGETVNDMTTITVDLVYGELDGSYPVELLPIDGYVEKEAVEFALPTHMSFLATSSFGGAEFEGAIGSTLVIDDLELIYED